MAVTREPLDSPNNFRVRQLQARDMLRGELDGVDAGAVRRASGS